MRRIFSCSIIVLMLLTVSGAEAKSIRVGMPLENAEALIKAVGAKEVAMAMYFAPGENLINYSLPDGRAITVISSDEKGKLVIKHLQVCNNCDQLKKFRNWDVVQEIELSRSQEFGEANTLSPPESGQAPDNLLCVFDTDCGWASGLPKKMGGCGCYSKGHIEAVKTQMTDGIHNSEPIIECESPPYRDESCLCTKSRCRLDYPTNYAEIPKSQALDIARKLCGREGYKWKDVSIKDDGEAWLIRTGGLQVGGDAEIRIDKATGEVLEKHFNPE